MRPPQRTWHVREVLGVLADGMPHWGWDLTKRTTVKQGNIYFVLGRMEQAGWITGKVDPTPRPGGHRIMYTLTPEGRAVAEEVAAEEAAVRPLTSAGP